MRENTDRGKDPDAYREEEWQSQEKRRNASQGGKGGCLVLLAIGILGGIATSHAFAVAQTVLLR